MWNCLNVPKTTAKIIVNNCALTLGWHLRISVVKTHSNANLLVDKSGWHFFLHFSVKEPLHKARWSVNDRSQNKTARALLQKGKTLFSTFGGWLKIPLNSREEFRFPSLQGKCFDRFGVSAVSFFLVRTARHCTIENWNGLFDKLFPF